MSTITLQTPILNRDPGFILTPQRRRRIRARFARHGVLLEAGMQAAQMRQAERLLQIRRVLRIDTGELREIAAEASPDKTKAPAWPSDMRELGEKIVREDFRALGPLETPVTNADRELVLAGLPPCLEVCRDDVQYTR